MRGVFFVQPRRDLDQAVNQPDGAVVAQLQSFRQFTHRDFIPSRKTFDGQQSLMLLGGNASSLSRLFAEMDKLSQRVAKLRERLILCLSELSGSCHNGLCLAWAGHPTPQCV